MLKVTITDEHHKYTRISKRRARKLFNSGTPVYFCPCKMRPGGPAHFGALIDPAKHREDFDKIDSDYGHYNSDSWEVGYYNSFYLQEVKES